MNCENHNIKSTHICFHCKKLICKQHCFCDHFKKTHREQLDKIDLYLNDVEDIKEYLNKFFQKNQKNQQNQQNQSEIFIEFLAESIWKVLKISTDRYLYMLESEKEIAEYFRKIHKYFTDLEAKFKRSIFENKDKLKTQINSKVKDLQEFIKIAIVNSEISTNNNNNNNSNNNNNNSNSLNGAIDNNSSDDMDCSQSETKSKEEPSQDRAEQYSIEYIAKSISNSSNIQSFVNANSQTLFNHNVDDTINILRELHKDDTDSILLDVILKYMKEPNNPAADLISNNFDSDQYYNDIRLCIKDIDFSRFGPIIQQTIGLVASTLPPSKTDLQGNYIMSTYQSNDATKIEGGVTLINTSNNKSEEFAIGHCFKMTYSSNITIGENIYIFGGKNNINQWRRISIKDKSTIFGEMIGIQGDCFISVCYDGQDHIYLVNGFKTNRIDRFNIKTMQFDQKYFQFTVDYGQQVSSMIFKACHDNNGTFYIHSRDPEVQFIRYNVESTPKVTNNLQLIPDLTRENAYLMLMYQRESSTSSFVYTFGGTKYGNFRYSIEDKLWEQYFMNNEKDGKERLCKVFRKYTSSFAEGDNNKKLIIVTLS
ncbi:hypothetical protein PPL_08289 [Heterostelium album PN500]|uniref:B box-type domain-containing protein n=1 Tax=Heterostelium pallidum (strain ATCC 26659 / Pp 5 / PN500) TaxID=670386 RepID=D3BHS5_HETP5|nr:hypothetical protein PPL_08289 [Heterostelium album PN500]EFA78825.1 hypothetical protein PPL_08289 [Heterostelium album PN500]|eukprot:XP_020430949.1 hypothetical protein PPL_08289 [Heterostelium album PN500]